MNASKNKENKMSPIDMARQTLMQLSKSQSLPTPENFARVYDEIAGIKSANSSEFLNNALGNVLKELGKDHPKYLADAQKISNLVKMQDSTSLEEMLHKLLLEGSPNLEEVNWGRLFRNTLKQLETNHVGLTVSRKRDSLYRVIINFGNESNQLGQKIQTLITSWGEGQAPIQIFGDNQTDAVIDEQELAQPTRNSDSDIIIANTDENQIEITKAWRDLLIKAITLLVLPQLEDIPVASARIESLIKSAQESKTLDEVNELCEALKSTFLRAEMQNDTQHRMLESLIQMLRLLVSSMGELTIEDKWLHGQIAIVQEIISKPLNIDLVYSAESSLKELILKQTSIKPGLLEAKETLKSMMSNFVSGLADITESTSTYKSKIKQYQNQITATDDISQLNNILQNLVGDIETMSVEAHKSNENFQLTQKKVEEAEKQISELTIKLDYISEIAHQDFLTGALNRRGMDEAIEREFNRADRHNTPISLAMIDIDHFKNINDTMGHSTGDVALAHLAKVVKGVIRSTDVLARYGGEEFVILLPGSYQDDAVKIVAGVQRDLTKNYFLHNNERVLITFSAGVAERMAGESIDDVLPRADSALYLAKQSGRNRVIGATLP
jgi:diguanylate cyclase